jgi:hypothetical protein
MCPEAHVFGDTIRHDLVVCKTGAKILKKASSDNLKSIFPGLVKTSEAESSLALTCIQKCALFQSANSILTLTSLSTVKLLL